jgi:hypothetical protein
MAATIALEMIGPMSGNRHKPLAVLISAGERFNLAGETFDVGKGA